MNFSDEEYVRLYVSDTVTWKCLGWDGQALLALALRKFDRSGVLEFGRHGAEKALHVATGMPLELIATALEKLVSEQVWVIESDRIFWPKYIDAQTCKRSERVRQRASRARRVTEQQPPERDTVSHGVTDGHESGSDVTNVTECHPRRGEARRGEEDLERGAGGNHSGPKSGLKRCDESFEFDCPGSIEFPDKTRTRAKRCGKPVEDLFEQFRAKRLRDKARYGNEEAVRIDFDAWLLTYANNRDERNAQRGPPVNEYPGADRRRNDAPPVVTLAPKLRSIPKRPRLQPSEAVRAGLAALEALENPNENP